ncbi:MAG: sulfatase-like hydrolase/transferase, partial [Bdellovibrionales bacterium]|nr:sulfatase-like hydrolase/transferase [Bdellovibrionales bacterium]
MNRKQVLAFLVSFFCVVAGPRPLSSQERPNILLIISDDQRYDQGGDFMPITQERIFNEGASFKKAYITTPACCPSRASILTGLYASHHKVFTNLHFLKEKTFVEDLKQSGYYTGLVGKYLNTANGDPRPEFDYWASIEGGSVSYTNPRMNINGKWRREKGYVTDVFADQAESFLDQALRQDKPFFLMFSVRAPHFPAKPPAELEQMYHNLDLHHPPSFNELDRSDKPNWLQARPLLSEAKQERIDQFFIKQLKCLWRLDEVIGEIVSQIESHGELDNTVIFYLSDNGLMRGEHGLTSKDVPYEPAIRVPFALRYPTLIPEPVTISDKIVSNIDIAPTIYDLAGIDPKRKLDGISLKKLLEGSEQWRQDLLIEGWRSADARNPFAALHTGDAIFVLNQLDKPELYDLVQDPYQLENLALDEEHTAQVENMNGRLIQL